MAGDGVTTLADEFIDAAIRKAGDYKIYSIIAKIKYKSTAYSGIFDEVVTVQIYRKVKNKWKPQNLFTYIYMDVVER